MLFTAIALSLISIAALAVVGYVFRLMWKDSRPVSRDRLESAIRPAASRVISWQAPARPHNHVGIN